MPTEVASKTSSDRRTLTAGLFSESATLAGVCINAVTLPLSLTVVGVTLQQIAGTFGSTFSQTQWVVDGYNVAFCAPLLAAGALADRFGRRKVFGLGVALFALASLLCGLAPGLPVLNAARVLQGFAAAFVLTSGSSLLANEFEGASRASAFGFLGASFGIGTALGPLVGGLLVSALNWRWAYVITIPFGLASLALLPRMKESRDPDAGRVDLAGTVTFTGTLTAAMFALVYGPDHGFKHGPALVASISAVALLGTFIFVESVQERPMFDLRLFRKSTFVAAQIVPLAVGFGFVAMLVNGPLYFQAVDRYSGLQAGLAMLPLTAPVFVVSLLSGRLSRFVSVRFIIPSGLMLITAGLLLMAWKVVPGSGWMAAAPGLLVAGLGTGLTFGTMDNLAVSVVPTERSGMAAGIFSTFRLSGDAFGIAAASAILVSGIAGYLRKATHLETRVLQAVANSVARGDFGSKTSGVAGLNAADAGPLAYTAGFHAVLTAFAAVTLLGALLTFFLIRPDHIGSGAPNSKEAK